VFEENINTLYKIWNTSGQIQVNLWNAFSKYVPSVVYWYEALIKKLKYKIWNTSGQIQVNLWSAFSKYVPRVVYWYVALIKKLKYKKNITIL
jgi:hypothetical protein